MLVSIVDDTLFLRIFKQSSWWRPKAYPPITFDEYLQLYPVHRQMKVSQFLHSFDDLLPACRWLPCAWHICLSTLLLIMSVV